MKIDEAKRNPFIYLEVVKTTTGRGYLKTVLLNAETNDDCEMLERTLFRIMNPGCLGWIRRLFKRG